MLWRHSGILWGRCGDALGALATLLHGLGMLWGHPRTLWGRSKDVLDRSGDVVATCSGRSGSVCALRHRLWGRLGKLQVPYRIPFIRLWGPSVDALGMLWGCCGDALGRTRCDDLGTLWECSGDALGRSGEALGRSGDALGRFGDALGTLCEDLGTLGGCSETI